MSRCELTGKGPVVKNLVSHSNIRTKSKVLPNIQKKRIFSKVLNEMVTVRIATSALKSMEKVGGIDTYILRLDDEKFSPRVLKIKNRILNKISKQKKA